jgi:hypothetical protein
VGQKGASKPGRTSPKALKTSHEEDNDKEWYLFELLGYALLYWWLTLDQMKKYSKDFIFMTLLLRQFEFLAAIDCMMAGQKNIFCKISSH